MKLRFCIAYLIATSFAWSSPPIIGEDYISSRGDERIVLISQDELEYTRDGITYLAKYAPDMRVDSSPRLRAILTRNGSTEVMYFLIGNGSLTAMNAGELSWNTQRTLWNQKPLNQARQLHLVIHHAAIQAEKLNKKSWPADIKASSSSDVWNMLVTDGYLNRDTLEKLGFSNFLIGNVSQTDPSDTIVLKSKWSYDGPKVIFTKGGDGVIIHPDQKQVWKDPPRNPAFLE